MVIELILNKSKYCMEPALFPCAFPDYNVTLLLPKFP